jgi:2-aminoadipate transaminase
MVKTQIAQINVPEGWIDFGIGQPQTGLLPLEYLAKAATHQFKRKDHTILQYGIQQGNGGLRISLAKFLSTQYGAAVDPGHLFITAGISQALDLICALRTSPGDTIIVEEPSYFLALRIFADYGLKIIGTPIDENGLIIEKLEEKLLKYNPIFIYTIPTFHNPTGVTLPANRREQLISLSEKYDFFIVADEVYQMLAYTSTPPQPMTYYDTSKRVFSLGSFSKILAPGLRLGWIHTKPSLMKSLISCGYLDSGGGLNPFVSSIVTSIIELGLQKDYLNFLKKTYHKRMVVLSQAMRKYTPALKFTAPHGGYFIWSCLSEENDTESLLTKAHKHQVSFQTGIKFSSSKGLKNYLRFSFAYYDEEVLVEGVKRFSRIDL